MSLPPCQVPAAQAFDCCGAGPLDPCWEAPGFAWKDCCLPRPLAPEVDGGSLGADGDFLFRLRVSLIALAHGDGDCRQTIPMLEAAAATSRRSPAASWAATLSSQLALAVCQDVGAAGRHALRLRRTELRRMWLAVVLGAQWQGLFESGWPIFGFLALLARDVAKVRAADPRRFGGCCRHEPCRSEALVLEDWLNTRGFYDGMHRNASNLYFEHTVSEALGSREMHESMRCFLLDNAFRALITLLCHRLGLIHKPVGWLADNAQQYFAEHVWQPGADPLQALLRSPFPLLLALTHIEAHPQRRLEDLFLSMVPRDGSILEAGAFDGKDTLRMADAVPQGTVYAFEPFPANYETVLRRIAGRQNIRTFHAALAGEDADERPFRVGRVNSATAMGSLLNYSEEYSKVYPHVKWSAAETDDDSQEIVVKVPVLSLGTWAATEGVTQLDMLWLDLEGLELEVLRSPGAAALLASASLVMAETRSASMYREATGAATLTDLRAVMERQHGFRLVFAPALLWYQTGHFNAFFAKPQLLGL